MFVEVEWDEGKAQENLRKHGIDFSDAYLVLWDEFSVVLADYRSGEERFMIIGATPVGEILVVVYTRREQRVRIISARRPMRHERRQYHEGI